MKETIAGILLDVGAVKLQPENPFTWSSGWKSPIYCDNRITLSYPDQRTITKIGLIELIDKYFDAAEAVAGVATGGIPQGAMVADSRGLPFFYVRSKAKEHGRGNMIEGKIEEGQQVVVVEDLISTGGSSLNAIRAVQDAGVEVLGLVAVFTYGFDVATRNFSDAGIEYHTLSDYQTLVSVALKRGQITPEQADLLAEWRKSPADWTP